MWKTSLFYSPRQTIWKFSKIPLTVDNRHLQRKLKIETEFSFLIFKLSLCRENLPCVSSMNQLFVEFTHTLTVLYHLPLTLVLLKGSLPSSYKFDTGTNFFQMCLGWTKFQTELFVVNEIFITNFKKCFWINISRNPWVTYTHN